jgi:hypothetical protein
LTIIIGAVAEAEPPSGGEAYTVPLSVVLFRVNWELKE